MKVPAVECQVGDLTEIEDLRKALKGIDYVIHLARSNGKTWAEYQQIEVAATTQLAECALEAGVKRLIFTGTIASYYQGSCAKIITEQTPLDCSIARGSLYASGAGATGGGPEARGRDRSRRQSVSLGGRDVVVWLRLPDLGSGYQ
jgi:nucleoside-diphosphate-sugar epimerase